MVMLILGILVAITTLFVWFGILSSDPSNTQESKNAANNVLWGGLLVAILFWCGWYFGG